MHALVLTGDFALSYSIWYVMFHIYLTLADKFSQQLAHLCSGGWEFPSVIHNCRKDLNSLLFRGGMSVIRHTIECLAALLVCIWSHKKGEIHAPEIAFFCLIWGFLYGRSALLVCVLSQSLPLVSYPTIKISSAIPKHWAALWKSHLSCTGTCHLLRLLQIVIFCIITHQTD